MSLFVIALGLALTIPLSAQTTWIVDGTGGPGSHFTEIQPAVDAAAPGDVILVRRHPTSAYPSFTVNKGVAILGAPAFSVFGLTRAVEIRGIPAGQTLVLANASASPFGASFGEAILISSSQGHVHLQEVTVGSPSLPGTATSGITIQTSRHVTLNNCTVGVPRFYMRAYQAGVSVTASDVTLTGSRIEGSNYSEDPLGFPPQSAGPGTGISAVNSTVELSRTDVRGGNGKSGATFPAGQPAIDARGSNVTLSGLAVNFVHGGTGTNPVEAIRADAGSTITVDDDLDLQGSGGSGPFGGSGSFAQRVVVSLDVGGGDLGGIITTQAASQQDDIVLIALSLPVPPTPMPPLGTQRIALASVFLVAAEVQPASGITADAVAVPNVAFLRGWTLGLQALNWDHSSGAVEWSNVGVVTVH